MEYSQLLGKIRQLCISQGELLEKALKSPSRVVYYTKTNKDKGWSDEDLNTDFDEIIESAFYKSLSQEFPDLGFHLEEHPELNSEHKEYTCFIDPIDGSKYFAKQVPFFAISVGVVRGEEPVLGAVYNPISNQIYMGAEGIPTTLNGEIVRISSNTILKKAVISADLASRKENWNEERVWMTQKLSDLIASSGKVRLFGNGALSCAWTASGGIDAFVSLWGHGSKPFDIMAGKALIKYAGGKTIDLKIPGIKQPRFVGGNERLVDKICEILLR